MTTSKRVARVAAKELRSAKTPRPVKEVAGSALEAARRNTSDKKRKNKT